MDSLSNALLSCWILGVSVIGGALAVFLVDLAVCLTGKMKMTTLEKGWRSQKVPPWLTGILERYILAVFVSFEPSSALQAIGGWMTLKIAVNWAKDEDGNNSDEKSLKRAEAFRGLLLNMISMSFAVVGGLLAAGHIRW